MADLYDWTYWHSWHFERWVAGFQRKCQIDVLCGNLSMEGWMLKIILHSEGIIRLGIFSKNFNIIPETELWKWSMTGFEPLLILTFDSLTAEWHANKITHLRGWSYIHLHSYLLKRKMLPFNQPKESSQSLVQCPTLHHRLHLLDHHKTSQFMQRTC